MNMSMIKKLPYSCPEAEIIFFAAAEIITASGEPQSSTVPRDEWEAEQML